MDSPTTNKVAFLKALYLYLVCFVTLMMMVVAVADIINIALRTYLFTKADKNFYGYPEPVCEPAAVTPTGTVRDKTMAPPCFNQADRAKQEEENRVAQRQRDLVRDISFLIVGLPLFALHWRIVRRKEAT